MKKLYFYFLSIVLLAVILAACAPAIESGSDTQTHARAEELTKGEQVTIYSDGRQILYRVIDSRASVVCWIVTEYYPTGISCLPLDQTDLSQ